MHIPQYVRREEEEEEEALVNAKEQPELHRRDAGGERKATLGRLRALRQPLEENQEERRRRAEKRGEERG